MRDKVEIMDMPSDCLLQVKNIKKYYPIIGGLIRHKIGDVKAVDGVSFYINDGETLGLVGESGCGKTTTGRTVLRLLELTSGDVLFNDPELGRVSLPSLNAKQLKQVRRNMQIIFQDPMSSLDPRMTVGDIIAEPLLYSKQYPIAQIKDRVVEMLETVGMSPDYRSRYPHAFSGGQRQRIGIARALSIHPKLVVCDEPVSALDVSIQAQVLNLLVDLQRRYKLTYLFVAHDLSVVEHISDRVAVMYVGYLVEMASTETLYNAPKHPYTEALLSAIPKPDPYQREKPLKLPGDVPSPANPPSGCYFHPRCRYAREICKVERPVLKDVGNAHWVACHFSEELSLQGVPRMKDANYTYPQRMTNSRLVK